MFFFFFFNDTATTEIYTLSLHDALPIWLFRGRGRQRRGLGHDPDQPPVLGLRQDRKSTRLNSSHPSISYAVFCLKKKKKITSNNHQQNKNRNILHKLTTVYRLLRTITPV